MNDLWISIGGIIVGIAATVIVAHYYFRRSIEKSLTPYIQFSSSPLQGIDPKVRGQLEVKYQNHSIDNLFEIQFLIANTGDKPNRDVIEPLSLKIPDDCTLLDASVVHVSPEGRKVNLFIFTDRKNIEYRFPLLNSNDFFISKLLLNGSPKETDFIFSIIADELPPKLIPTPLPYDAVGTSRKREFEFPLLTVGIIVTALGLSVFKLVYDGWSRLPNFTDLGFIRFLTNLGWGGWALLVSVLPAFLFVLLGVMMTVLSFTEGSFPPAKKKFIVPDDRQLLRQRGFLVPSDMEIMNEKKNP